MSETTTPTLTLTRRHKRTIEIDDAPIRVSIARFTAQQHTDFTKALTRLDEPESLRRLLVRKPGEEQATRLVARARPTPSVQLLASILEPAAPALDQLRQAFGGQAEWAATIEALNTLRAAAAVAVSETQEIETFVVPDGEIMRRRREEMSPAEREAFTALEREEETEAQTLIAAALSYIEVEPGQIVVEEEDGARSVVTRGEDLGALYAGRTGVMRACVREVWAANTVGVALKNASGSQSDSQPSSIASATGAPGPRPETTAAAAAREASAGIAAATGATADSSSGSTTTSS